MNTTPLDSGTAVCASEPHTSRPRRAVTADRFMGIKSVERLRSSLGGDARLAVHAMISPTDRKPSVIRASACGRAGTFDLRVRHRRARSGMPKTHKEILMEGNDATFRGEFEGFLVHCTEETVWNFLGDKTLRGKEAVRRWMIEAYKEPPRFNVRQLIEDGDFLAAVGEITLKDDNGKATDFSYCDVWRFENGRIAELNAFVINASLVTNR